MKMTVKGLGDVGMVTDRAPYDLPQNAWSSLRNVRCKRGRIEPIDGYSSFTSLTNATSEPIYVHQLVSTEVDATFYWVFPYDLDGDGTAEKIYAYDGTTATNITRQVSAADVDYTGTGLWQVTQFNGLVVLNNGTDAPQYWAGSGKCTFLPYDGSTTWAACDVSETEFDTDATGGANDYKAKVIRAFQNTLIALNITENTTSYPQMLHWSGPADPGAVPTSWDYGDPTTQAGRFVLAETNGYVLDAVPLGDMLVVYKEDAIYRLSLVGGQFIYDRDTITTSHGLWATNCAVDIGGRHVCLGNGTVYVHAGGEISNILEGRAADFLFDSIDPDNYDRAFLTHNQNESEVWICYPEIGYERANKALIWNYGNNTWYQRDIPQCSTIKPGVVVTTAAKAWSDYTTETWADLEGAWVERNYSPIGDTLVAAGTQLIKFGDGQTTDPVFATRTDLMVSEVDGWYQVREIIPLAAGDAVTVRIGRQSVFGDTVIWENEKTFTPGTTRKLDVRVSSPIFAMQFSGAGDWQVSGYTVDLVQKGNR